MKTNHWYERIPHAVTMLFMIIVFVTLLTYIMLSTKGLDGIRILSLLGGFPALFIIIFASISLIRFLFNKKLLKLEN